MVAALQPNITISAYPDYLTGGLWGAAMSDDLIAAAYALYYFHPTHDGNWVDDNDPLEAAAANCLHADMLGGYTAYVYELRQGHEWHEIDSAITDAVNDDLPEPVVDAEFLAFGALQLPWMGFDWYHDPGTYTHMPEGFRHLADAIGIDPEHGPDVADQTHGIRLAHSAYQAGYGDVAAAIYWLVGACTSDLLNYSYEAAAESGLEYPPLDQAQAWVEETRLCNLYAAYANRGVAHIEQDATFKACLSYNTLLLRYQTTYEENYVRLHTQNAPIQEGFIWASEHRQHAPEPPDDLDLLSFWHRPPDADGTRNQ